MRICQVPISVHDEAADIARTIHTCPSCHSRTILTDYFIRVCLILNIMYARGDSLTPTTHRE